MKVLYYYYYLFYTRIIPDDEPHATTIFTLSISQALLVNYSIDFIAVHLLCRFLLGKWAMITTSLLIIGINYLYYSKNGKGKEIILEKPKFFKSNGISIIMTGLFFSITTSFLFWMADYLMYVIDKCKP
jgi:hypothetical protein